MAATTAILLPTAAVLSELKSAEPPTTESVSCDVPSHGAEPTGSASTAWGDKSKPLCSTIPTHRLPCLTGTAAEFIAACSTPASFMGAASATRTTATQVRYNILLFYFIYWSWVLLVSIAHNNIVLVSFYGFCNMTKSQKQKSHFPLRNYKHDNKMVRVYNIKKSCRIRSQEQRVHQVQNTTEQIALYRATL